MRKIKYYFKDKLRRLKNLIKWAPIIWGLFDFDYMSSIDVFKFQLEQIAKSLESDNAYTLDAKYHAQRIRLVLRLMTKVYNEEYSIEHYQVLKDKYGENVFDYEFVKIDLNDENGDDLFELKDEYENWNNADEINDEYKRLSLISNEKQKKAHRILWKLIEKDIQNWWD